MSVSTQHPYLEALSRRVLVYDGAMGTSIQLHNPTPEDFGGKELEGCNDNLVLTRPDIIQSIHESFLEAGADVVETCTFQSTPRRLEEWGLGDKVRDINVGAARLAREQTKYGRGAFGGSSAAQVAEQIVMQTVAGSVSYARSSGKHLAELRNMVTSPGGTSAEAIYQMEKKRAEKEPGVAAYLLAGLGHPEAQVWPTVLGVVRNAFVRGLTAGLSGLPPPLARKSMIKASVSASRAMAASSAAGPYEGGVVPRWLDFQSAR